MDPLYIVLFLAGVGVAFILPQLRIVTQKPGTALARPRRRSQLDMTDEMVLWGEVTGDEFYDLG